VRILKACTGIKACDFEEFPVALHAPIYPPRPHFLTLSPASDLHSGHASPFVRCVSEILACVRSLIASFLPERLNHAGWAVLFYTRFLPASRATQLCETHDVAGRQIRADDGLVDLEL
jgi:hypothetical protein